MDKKFEYVICGLGIFALIVGVFITSSRNNAAEEKYTALASELRSLNNDIAITQKNDATKKQKLVQDATGISVDQVKEDASLAESFFKGAFTWTSGDEYNKNRESYIEKLGKNNTFVETYMQDNTTVDDYNKVDVFNLKSQWDNITMYPVKKINDSSYEYIAVVTFYLYKSSSDLDSKNKLTPSQAIISFRADGADDARVISNVSAWSGFDS